MVDHTPAPEPKAAPAPGARNAAVDIVIYLIAALSFWELEELLRRLGKFPYPGLFDGGLSQVLSFGVVWVLLKWRRHGWTQLGLRRPDRWWTIPVWGVVVLIVSIAAQLTIVPLLARMFHAPPPDLGRYDIIRGNLPLFLVTTTGAMITGGFIEEVIYRGFAIDRLARIFGGGKGGLWLAALSCGVPFGLIHFQWGIGGMLVTAVMGSVLGLMYLATRRNLWPLIAAHATMDFILMLQVYFGGLNP